MPQLDGATRVLHTTHRHDDPALGAARPQIASGRFDEPESTLATAGGDIAKLVQHAEETGINAELPRFAAGLFARAKVAGFGAEEHAALIKVLRVA
ncbi:beta-hydroxyacid dehydrogenase [Labilithrix luteola]|uniref:Beta-hydroxyacid dehydrogenase n=1 Tax=Labilithrix luteola TaxID=1391654 RepID=A0A0K1PU31_9BACT|nr:hypothetical protein [Labilithrix luteola]AKU96871.1 beta-hydroxyacid dehydrogenase [Labilithrix luteola]